MVNFVKQHANNQNMQMQRMKLIAASLKEDIILESKQFVNAELRKKETRDKNDSRIIPRETNALKYVIFLLIST